MAPACASTGLRRAADSAGRARQYLQALGGADNLIGIDACITRLRLIVKDSARIDDGQTRRLGAAGVIRLNPQRVQIVVGTQAEIIASAMRRELERPPRA